MVRRTSPASMLRRPASGAASAATSGIPPCRSRRAWLRRAISTPRPLRASPLRARAAPPPARAPPGLRYGPRMPELPDVTLYVEHLRRRLIGARLTGARIRSPNLLRTVEPPLAAAFGREVCALRRVGKRIVIELEGSL